MLLELISATVMMVSIVGLVIGAAMLIDSLISLWPKG
jgi:hypothetical protein